MYLKKPNLAKTNPMPLDTFLVIIKRIHICICFTIYQDSISNMSSREYNKTLHEYQKFYRKFDKIFTKTNFHRLLNSRFLDILKIEEEDCVFRNR